MKMMKNKKIKLTFVLTLLSILFLSNSCESRFESKQVNDGETANSGKLTIEIDDEIATMMDSALAKYRVQYKNVALTNSYVNARKAMASLLSGKLRVVVISRNYLADEDSLMKAYKVEKHQKVKIADDALVFFVNKESKMDTLNQNDIIQHFNQEKDFLPSKVLITNVNSSVYGNFVNILQKKKIITQKLSFKKTTNEVIREVEKSNSAIGVAYLSQIAKNEKVKPIKISYYDSLNVYTKGLNVHQSNLVQKKYPFIVSHYAYLLENHQDLPYWFAFYLGKEFKVQKLFLDAGIVPAYAIIKLKYDE